MKRLFLSLMTLCLLSVLTASAYKKESLDIIVNGQSRNMVVFTPNTVNKNIPLMIVTHGMNQSPEYQFDGDKFYNLVDTAQFVVTYLRSDGSTWDIGGTKDQNFVTKTIDEIIAEKGYPGELIKFDLSEVGKTLLLNTTESRDVALSKVQIKWEVQYFSSLGQFVYSQSGVVACNDKSVFGTDCVANPGNVFLMWDAHTDKGRWVGTGVYIAKLKFKIVSDTNVIGRVEDTFNLGVRRSERQ